MHRDRLLKPDPGPLGRVLILAFAISAAAVGAVALPDSHATAATRTKAAAVSMALVLDDCVNPVERPLRAGAQQASKKYKFSLKIVCPTPVTAQAQIALMQTL